MELVVAVSILSLLIVIVAPAMAKHIRRAREARYLAEAQDVCVALQMYLIDLEESGDIMPEWKISAIMQDYPVSSKKNVLYPYLSHESTEGAYIYYMTFNKTYLTSLYYSVNGYKIVVKVSGETRIVEYPDTAPTSDYDNRVKKPGEAPSYTDQETE